MNKGERGQECKLPGGVRVFSDGVKGVYFLTGNRYSGNHTCVQNSDWLRSLLSRCDQLGLSSVS